VIPNAQLTLAHLPGPDAGWDEIERFALTFDGYSAIGPRLGELAKKHFDEGTLPESLDELRGCINAAGGTSEVVPTSARWRTSAR
jgi:hypothetical protein